MGVGRDKYVWPGQCAALILLVTVASTDLRGQEITWGTVRDCATEAGLPYAGVLNRSRGSGTVADSAGNFEVRAMPADTLRFSALGYASRDTVQAGNSGPLEVCLTAAPARLPVAVHTAKRFNRLRRYGNDTESRQIVTGWSVEPRSGAERGTRIRVGRKPKYLKAIELHLAQSTYDRLRLRLKLYPAVPDAAADRPTHAWLLDTDRRTGWVSVEVLADGIEVQGEFFVSVEVVEAWSPRDENTLLLSAGLLTDGLYFREGVAEPWQRGKVGLGLRVVTVGE